MTTAECIRQRVSCRRFQETPIPREDIRRVVDLARFSPSWKNTQPVRYIVIDDPALKERMARECIPGQGFNTKTINRAAALAVIAYVPGLAGQGDAPLTERQAAGWEMFDAGIAAQTFCLAARDLGIGTCILGIFDAGAAGRPCPAAHPPPWWGGDRTASVPRPAGSKPPGPPGRPAAFCSAHSGPQMRLPARPAQIPRKTE